MARSGFARIVTTGGIEGWSITDYKGLVSSNVVTGTGFFSDFAASFTDVFGGRSRTYGNQLRSLQVEAINELAEQAGRMGANWVIGARIDFDEISGKGMQMFMVSAQGTAVVAAPMMKEHPGQAPLIDGAVSGDELEGAVARALLVRSATAGQIQFTPTTWKQLAEHHVEEALIPALKHIVSTQYATDAEAESVRQEFVTLLNSVPVRAAQRELHKAIVEDPDCALTAMGMIQQYSLLDLAWVRDHLKGADYRLRHTAVQLLNAHAPMYDRSSLDLMAEIIETLRGAFPDRAIVMDKKGLFTKQGAKEWQCSSCNERNDLDEKYCLRCFRDRRGLTQRDLTPEKATSMFQVRVECLRVALSEDGAGNRNSATVVATAM